MSRFLKKKEKNENKSFVKEASSETDKALRFGKAFVAVWTIAAFSSLGMVYKEQNEQKQALTNLFEQACAEQKNGPNAHVRNDDPQLQACVDQMMADHKEGKGKSPNGIDLATYTTSYVTTGVPIL